MEETKNAKPSKKCHQSSVEYTSSGLENSMHRKEFRVQVSRNLFKILQYTEKWVEQTKKKNNMSKNKTVQNNNKKSLDISSTC